MTLSPECLKVLWCLMVVALAQSLFIPVFKTSGSYYQVGYNIGAHFRERIQQFNSIDKDLHEKLVPFYNTAAGRKVYGELLKASNTTFPHYIRELTGTADGAQLNFTLVFLMTVRVEVLHVLGYTDDLKGCSDVFISTDDMYAFGHNEDTNPAVKDLGYFVDVNITEGDDSEQFLAYTYPGLLPGKAFGFNHRLKFAFSVNALYPNYVALHRPGRDLVNRAIAGSKDVDSAMKNLHMSAAYGFSTNFAFPPDGEDNIMGNYELLPNPDDVFGNASVLAVLRKEGDTSGSLLRNAGRSEDGDAKGHYFHFNMYDHTANVTEVKGAIVSSQHRKGRAEHMQVPKTLGDIKNILGDTKDQQYPIYRTPRPTDQASTAATAIFDLNTCTMTVTTENPKTAREPQIFKFNCQL